MTTHDPRSVRLLIYESPVRTAWGFSPAQQDVKR